MEQQLQPKQLQIAADNEVLKGRYANMMQVSHSPEEFVLDFYLAHLPAGQMIARIITSPGHLKRIISALQTNLKKYEDTLGKIDVAEEPKNGFGF